MNLAKATSVIKETNSTWVIIPLYNEEFIIGNVIQNLLESFENIVCVDDGSRDLSAQIALRAGAHVVRHPFNLGQGASLQTGITYALTFTDAEYFITFDADGQHSTSDAIKMLQRLQTEPLDIIVGSRFLDDRTKVSFLKRIVLRTAAFVEKISSGINLTDAHNGLRAMNRVAAEQIQITQNRMAHATEFVQLIKKHKLRYSEEAVVIRYTEYSKAKGQSLWNSVNILNDLWIK